MTLLVFVKADMQDFPVANGDAGMTALMALVAIMATKGVNALGINIDFVDGADADAMTSEWLLGGGLFVAAVVCKAVFA